MKTSEIRAQLHNFIEAAEEKKVKAIYTLFEEEIAQSGEYSNTLKDELDRRYDDYKKGRKMVSAGEMSKEIKKILTSDKTK
jgi:hypothetical protein